MAILLAGRAGSIKLPATDHRRRRRRRRCRRTGSHWTGSPVGRETSPVSLVCSFAFPEGRSLINVCRIDEGLAPCVRPQIKWDFQRMNYCLRNLPPRI